MMDDDKKRAVPWERAFADCVGDDSTLLNPEEAMRLRRERLRNDLKVEGVTDVDQAVEVAQTAILKIIRGKTAFRMEILDGALWPALLSDYEKVRAEKVELSKDPRVDEFDSDLLVLRSKLADALRPACSDPINREELEKLLECEGIKMVTDRVVRLLISEINAEYPEPRIIGLLPSLIPHHRPWYVALPAVKFSPEFMSVCRIFDH
jgi:hypothetical protein